MKPIVCFNCLEVYDEDSLDCIFFESQSYSMLHFVGHSSIEAVYRKCPHCFATAENSLVTDKQAMDAIAYIKACKASIDT